MRESKASTGKHGPLGKLSPQRVLLWLFLSLAGMCVLEAKVPLVEAKMFAAISPLSPELDSLPRLEAAEQLAELEVRAAMLLENLSALEEYFEQEIAPVERFLLQHSRDSLLVREIALAVHRGAVETGLSPWLIVGVLITENAPLKPTAVSPVGARGLMQVMPRHAGGWGCGSSELFDVASNMCHGVRILATNIARAKGDLRIALLRYNGCVYGANTPNCHTYPDVVLRRAARAERFAALDREGAPLGSSVVISPATTLSEHAEG